MPSTQLDTPLRALDDALTGLRRLWLRPDRRRRFLAELGMPVPLSTLRSLRAIELAGPEPSIGDVAAALAVDASTASRLIDQAVTAGYVTRRPSEADRRRTVLGMTERGEEILAHATQVRTRLLGEVTAGWNEGDVRTLVGLLERFERDAACLEDGRP